MKRFILPIMVLLPFSAMASIPEVQKLTKSFTSNNKASAVNISKQMLKMMGDDRAGMEYVDNIIVLTSNNKSAAKAINKRTQRITKKHKLENLATLNKNKATTSVYVLSSNDKITEAIVLIAEKKKSVLINISGNIPQEFATTLLSTLQF